MSAINDGGPAFPREDYQTADAPGQRGLSARDYFAIRAPIFVADAAAAIGYTHPHTQSIIADHRIRPLVLAKLCELRYEYADAMLAARSK